MAAALVLRTLALCCRLGRRRHCSSTSPHTAVRLFFNNHADGKTGHGMSMNWGGRCRVDEAEVEKRGSGHVLRADPSIRVSSRAHKMSKSRGNVVNPDDVVTMYGADSLRLYEMFMGPLRDTKVCTLTLALGKPVRQAS